MIAICLGRIWNAELALVGRWQTLSPDHAKLGVVVRVLPRRRHREVGDGSFAKGELAKLFSDGFEILRDEIVDGVPDRASLVRPSRERSHSRPP